MQDETRPSGPQPYDASDPEQVEKAKLLADRRRLEREAFLKDVLGSAQGRDWLWETISACQPFARQVSPGVTDLLAVGHNLGAASVGMALFRKCLATDARATMMMVQEGGGIDG